MEKEIVKHYSNGEITVIWKPAVCIHSKKCWNAGIGLPSVFNPRVRPWVNMDGADSTAIKLHVDQCPSRALTYFYNEENRKTGEGTAGSGTTEATDSLPGAVLTEVQVLPDGPLLVKGKITVTDRDGGVSEKSNVTAFCRCGQSSNKPYCDGSHAPANFRD